nr:MAG: RNA-dependent RNA polymerase [brine shrimp orbivirus 2]
MVFGSKPWDHIKKLIVGKDSRLYKDLERRSLHAKEFLLTDLFLDVVKVDTESTAHKFLMERSQECIRYGLLNMVDYFRFYCNFFEDSLILRNLSYLLDKYPVPFKEVKNGTVLEDICGFYTLPSTFACLLEGLEICLLQPWDEIVLKRKWTRTNLERWIVKIAVSPKVCVKAIRGFVAIVAQLGSMGSKGEVLVYESECPKVWEDEWTEYVQSFRSSEHITQFFELGRKSLNEWGLSELYDFCVEYYHSCMNFKTARDIIQAGSLLLTILRLGGYGRAFKYSSVAKSAPEPDVPDEFTSLLRRNVRSLHTKACEAGFKPLNSEEWMIECLSKYGSTSSGMSPISFTLKDATGHTMPGKSGSKAVVGLVHGDYLFTREAMSVKTTREKPNKVGFRDVPIRTTRGIFVVPMATLNASVANTAHLMSYSGTRGKSHSRYGQIDASHMSVGEFETSGVRILDDWRIITTSGTHGLLSLDIDLSEYDSHNVRSNWRDPINDELKAIFADCTEKMGPSGLSRCELVDLASGEGILVNSYWDNARKPFFFSRFPVDDGIETHFGSKIDVRPLKGGKGLCDVTVWVVDCTLSEGIKRKLQIGTALDGSDLFVLTSEASGEFTTLLFNGVMTLSIAQWVIERLSSVEYGKSLLVGHLNIVGDDIHSDLNMRYPPQAYDEFMTWLVKTVSQTGHIVNVFKTMICPYTSNYRQTHAIRGLYLPKDQVMTSTSEKSRAIFDPLGYLGSRRSVYTTRLTRGVKPLGCTLLFCLEYRFLMGRRLKYSSIAWGKFTSMGSLKYRKSSVVLGKREKTYEVWCIRPSLVTAALPNSFGGIGLDPRNLILFTAPGDFSSPLGRELLYVGLCMRQVFEPPSIQQFTHDLKANQIYETLFSESHRESIRNLASQGVDLGRLNAERIGERLLDRALSSERRARFGVAGFEELAVKKLVENPLSSPSNIPSDTWINCFSFEMIEDEKWSTMLSPMVSLDFSLQRLFDMYGAGSRNRQRAPRDVLMSMISREKHLRGSISPEIVVSLLRKLQMDCESDRKNALVVLKRLGFHEEIASQIFTLFINNMGELLSGVKTGGACSDEISQAIGLLDPGNRPFELSMPRTCSPLEQYELSVRAAQEVLKQGILYGKKVKSISISLRSDPNQKGMPHRKFPKTLKSMSEGKILSSAVSDALRLDLNN